MLELEDIRAALDGKRVPAQMLSEEEARAYITSVRALKPLLDRAWRETNGHVRREIVRMFGVPPQELGKVEKEVRP